MAVQREAFLYQTRLASQKQLPIVLHIRKATDIIMHIAVSLGECHQ